MAVHVRSSNPAQLLAAINREIASGSIATWKLDSDGDITHARPQWLNVAWMRPSIQSNELVFNILGKKGTKLSGVAYAVYHGRLIEMLLAHFDKMFSLAWATSMAETGDIFSGFGSG